MDVTHVHHLQQNLSNVTVGDINHPLDDQVVHQQLVLQMQQATTGILVEEDQGISNTDLRYVIKISDFSIQPVPDR